MNKSGEWSVITLCKRYNCILQKYTPWNRNLFGYNSIQSAENNNTLIMNSPHVFIRKGKWSCHQSTFKRSWFIWEWPWMTKRKILMISDENSVFHLFFFLLVMFARMIHCFMIQSKPSYTFTMHALVKVFFDWRLPCRETTNWSL